jgi:hypothetical protein
MTREEFESILEEAYIEGYNTAIEDIQEDILDEEAFDLEGEYDYYTESSKAKKEQNKATLQHTLDRSGRFTPRGFMGGYVDKVTGKDLDSKGRSTGWTDERAHNAIKRQLLRTNEPSKANQRYQKSFVRKAGEQFGGDGTKYVELLEKKKLKK